MTIKLSTYHHGEDIPELTGINRFHSKDLFLIFEQTPGYTPYMYAVYDDDTLIYRLVAVVQRDRHFFSHSFVRRCEVFGCGEFTQQVEDESTIFEMVLDKLTKDIDHKAFIIEFRNLEKPLFGYRSFRKNHYFPVNWMRVHNSLHSEKKVEQRMSSNRLRQIKKAHLAGALAEEAQNEDDIKALAKMLRKTYSSHIRQYFPDLKFFFHIYNEWVKTGKAKIFVVRYKDKIIGGSLCLYSNNNAYLWFAGGMRKTYPKQRPNILAVWKAIEDAQACGCWHFEFMDVGLPFKKHGFREFVLQFGGIQSSTRRWFRFRWNWLNKLCTSLYT